MSAVNISRRAALVLATALRLTAQPSASVALVRRRAVSVPVTGPGGHIASRFPATHGVTTLDLNGPPLEISCIPGGSFEMGTTQRLPGVLTTPIRRVEIRPFGLGVFEVTYGQWKAAAALPRVTRDLRLWMPAQFENELSFPASEGISHEQALEFCARVSRHTGHPVRLPSEAEWEYACRAGTSTFFHFGDEGGSPGSDVLARGRYNSVGSKNAPNRFGLHDMHESVAEHCADLLHRDYTGAPTVSEAWMQNGESLYRMFRGRSTLGAFGRDFFPVGGYFSGLGMRVALNLGHEIMDPLVEGVYSAASQSKVMEIAPGDLVMVRGSHLRSPEALRSAGEPGLLLGESNGLLLHTTPQEMLIALPLDLTPGVTMPLVAHNGVQSAQPVDVRVVLAAPALFTLDGTGQGRAAALNESGFLNANVGAAPGSVMTVFLSGLGRRVLGEPVPVDVRVGGVPALIEYAGQAPGYWPGAGQINFRLGAQTPAGEQPIEVFVGGRPSQPGVTVRIN